MKQGGWRSPLVFIYVIIDKNGTAIRLGKGVLMVLKQPVTQPFLMLSLI
ncbi:hypothetical protein ACF2JD_04495 [Aeromonas sp. A-5]